MASYLPLPTALRPETRSTKQANDRKLSLGAVLLSLAILCFVLLSPARVAFRALLPVRKPGRFCDVAPCVFDVGHNTGQDTYDYLHSGPPNVRVVAVDANPVLIQNSSARFADAIRASRLRLVNTGLVRSSPAGGGVAENLTFWINDRNNKFSSFDEKLGCRTPWGEFTEPGSKDRACRQVHIPTATCAQLLRQYGTPVYLKVDIEGMDMVCLSTLTELPLSQRPQYVSLENVWKQLVFGLVDMGYTQFKVVDQVNVSRGRPAELQGASGPWGENAVDCQRGHKWSSASELADRIPSLPRSFKDENGNDRKIWYDLHGKRDIS